MTELGSSREVSAPHIFEVSSNVSPAEQSLALDETAMFRRLVFGYEGRVGVRTVDLDRLVVTKKFDAW